jgi:hypothetical protein
MVAASSLEPRELRAVLLSTMPKAAALLGAGLAALLCACGPVAFARPSILPLRTLRLYETGVGYFERTGVLDASANTSLPVPAGHLDDALATLVVLDPGGHARVHGVEFGSSLSRGMARALAGLPTDADTPLGLEQVLTGLKGARVRVRAHDKERTGRLIEIVRGVDDTANAKPPPAPATPTSSERPEDAKARTPSSLTLLILTDKGEIVRALAKDVDSVEPLDPSYAVRLGSALDALSTRSAQSERLLRVLAPGGKVTLGYVAETPVWRATYRMVLDPKGASGVLEGWALVHNDTDEDWQGVRVELANGRPDAFLFPLAAPRYTRRPLVTPDDELATVPQLMGTTVDSIWGDRTGEAFGAGGLSLSGVGEGGGGRGEGVGLGTVGSIGHGNGSVGASSSPLLEVGNLSSIAQAKGVEAGALFVYTLPEPVDLHARGSALVPFSQQNVNAQTITWLDAPDAPARSAVRFVNSTAQTLPPGTIAFFGDGGFAGESALPRLKSGEVRFITYGMDLDVELRAAPDPKVVDDPQHLVWDSKSKTLSDHFLRTSDFTYDIKNRSAHPRTVMLSIPLDVNATLTGPDRVDFDTVTSHPLAVFLIDAQKTTERKTHAVEGLVQRLALGSLSSAWLSDIATKPSLPAEDRAAAGEAAARLREAEQSAASAKQMKNDIAEVEKDLDRLREHMKAFAGERATAGAQGNPFATRVLAGEDKLLALRDKQTRLEVIAKAKHEAAETALGKLARS